MNKLFCGSTRIKIMLIIMLLFFTSLTVSGCGIFKKDSNEQSKESEQNEKIPKPLTELETSLESIFRTLGAPATGNDKESSEQQKNSEGQEGTEDKEGTKDKEGTENKEGGGEEQQGQVQNKNEPWEQISQTLDQLHEQWNEYMPEAAEKSTDSKVIDNFSDSLNNLTNIITEQDKVKTLLAANNLHSSIPEFYSFYKTKHIGEIKRMVFYTRSCILYSQSEKWTEVDSYMEDLESSWTFLKSALAKEEVESVSKLDLSIYELKKVAEVKDSQLINIKGRLTIANIEELEKALKESSEKESK